MTQRTHPLVMHCEVKHSDPTKLSGMDGPTVSNHMILMKVQQRTKRIKTNYKYQYKFTHCPCNENEITQLCVLKKHFISKDRHFSHKICRLLARQMILQETSLTCYAVFFGSIEIAFAHTRFVANRTCRYFSNT